MNEKDGDLGHAVDGIKVSKTADIWPFFVIRHPHDASVRVVYHPSGSRTLGPVPALKAGASFCRFNDSTLCSLTNTIRGRLRMRLPADKWPCQKTFGSNDHPSILQRR